MICKKCKSEIPEGVDICETCGAKTAPTKAKRKKILIFIALSVAVVLIAGMIALHFLLKNHNGSVSLKTLQTSLEDAISPIQDPSEDVPDFLQEMEDRAGYEVISIDEEKDGSVRATVQVYAPDLYNTIRELDAQNFSDTSEMDKAVTAKIQEADILKKEVSIIFTQEDGVWVPVLTDIFIDAYYGGLLTYRQELFEQMEEDAQ